MTPCRPPARKRRFTLPYRFLSPSALGVFFRVLAVESGAFLWVRSLIPFSPATHRAAGPRPAQGVVRTRSFRVLPSPPQGYNALPPFFPGRTSSAAAE